MRRQSDRVLLVGEAPPEWAKEQGRHSPLFPLPRASTGGRICEMAGLSVKEYVARTTRLNLCQRYGGYSAAEYRSYFAWLATGDLLCSFSSVILVGSRVRDAAIRTLRPSRGGVSSVWPSCEWAVLTLSPEHSRVAWIPHPSGKNRQLNRPEERERVSKFLREALGGTPDQE